MAKLFAQEKAQIKESVEFRASLPANGTQVVHAPHMRACPPRRPPFAPGPAVTAPSTPFRAPVGGAESDCSSLNGDGAQFLWCAVPRSLAAWLFPAPDPVPPHPLTLPFRSGLAVRVFEAYFGKDTLLNCLADAAVGIDDFWHAASQIKSAYSDWDNDHDITVRRGSAKPSSLPLSSCLTAPFPSLRVPHRPATSSSTAPPAPRPASRRACRCSASAPASSPSPPRCEPPPPALSAAPLFTHTHTHTHCGAAQVAGIVGDLESGFGDIIEALKALFSARDIALKAEDIISHWGDYIEVGEDAGAWRRAQLLPAGFSPLSSAPCGTQPTSSAT